MINRIKLNLQRRQERSIKVRQGDHKRFIKIILSFSCTIKSQVFLINSKVGGIWGIMKHTSSTNRLLNVLHT